MYARTAAGPFQRATPMGFGETYGVLSVIVVDGGNDLEATTRSRCQIRAGVGARMLWVLAYFAPQALSRSRR
jgi:hypothetical protein